MPCQHCSTFVENRTRLFYQRVVVRYLVFFIIVNLLRGMQLPDVRAPIMPIFLR